MAAIAPNPSSSPSSRVTRDTAAAAVDALLRWINAQAKHKKSQLLEHDEFIHVVLTMKKIPSKSRTNPYHIPLLHPLHTGDSSSICLFVDDRATSPVTPAIALDKIRSDSIPISDVIGISQLKSDYVAYEARRKLCGSYDLFVADRRILPLLPRLIGKQFFKKKKHPLPIDLSHKNWKEQLRRSCGSALLYLRTGTSCQINAGRLSMGRDEILENVVTVVEGAVKLIPKKWRNVRSIHVKSEESVGLPIYQALPEMGLKIEVGSKVAEKVGDESDGRVGSGEVVQSVKEEEVEGKGSNRKVKNFSSKKGKKVHKIRYMDNDLDNVDLNSDGGDKREDGDESDGEEGKVTKKKEKDVKLKKAKKGKITKEAEDVDADENAGGLDEDVKVDTVEVKKRKARGKKSEGKEEVVGKKTKKSKMKL